MKIFNPYPISNISLLFFSLVLVGCTEPAYSPRQQELLAQFDKGIAKRGQLFFVHVCSNCHQDQYQIEVPPNGRTMDEWHTYLKQNKHKTNSKIQSLSDYFALNYRSDLVKKDKTMELLLDINEDDIYSDLGSYLLNGAKDSDNPKSCN